LHFLVATVERPRHLSLHYEVGPVLYAKQHDNDANFEAIARVADCPGGFALMNAFCQVGVIRDPLAGVICKTSDLPSATAPITVFGTAFLTPRFSERGYNRFARASTWSEPVRADRCIWRKLCRRPQRRHSGRELLYNFTLKVDFPSSLLWSGARRVLDRISHLINLNHGVPVIFKR
jgi:hypothetical protein